MTLTTGCDGAEPVQDAGVGRYKSLRLLGTRPKVVRCVGQLPPRGSKGRERATDLPSALANADCRAVERSGDLDDGCPLLNEDPQALVVLFSPTRVSRWHFSFRCF
jgi:hypothetical protein